MTRPHGTLRLPQPPTHGSHPRGPPAPRPAPTASGTLSGARQALGAKISHGGPSQTHNPVLWPVGLRRDAGPRSRAWERRDAAPGAGRGSGWAVRRTSMPHFPMPTPLQARPAKKYMHRKKEQRAASAVQVLGEGSCEQRPRRLARVPGGRRRRGAWEHGGEPVCCRWSSASAGWSAPFMGGRDLGAHRAAAVTWDSRLSRAKEPVYSRACEIGAQRPALSRALSLGPAGGRGGQGAWGLPPGTWDQASPGQPYLPTCYSACVRPGKCTSLPCPPFPAGAPEH